MGQQVANRHGQIMIRVHQACRRRHNAVPVGIGIVAKGHAVMVLQPDQPRHCVRAGAVHAHLAVVIDWHERESRVQLRVNYRDAQSIGGVNGFPIRQGSAAQRVHAQLKPGGPDGVHINDVPQVLDVRQNEVLLKRGSRIDGRVEGHALHIGIVLSEQLVGPVLNPLRHARFRRAAVGRVVLEPAVLRRVMRGRDHDAVRQPVLAAPVMDEDGPRDDRCRRHPVVGLNDGLDIVGRQHFERGALGRRGERVGVLAHAKRAVNALAAPVIADSLRDGQDVRFGKGAAQGGAPVPGRAEADQLLAVANIRLALVILTLKP